VSFQKLWRWPRSHDAAAPRSPKPQIDKVSPRETLDFT
jgi:hypothetical protein